MLCKQLALNYHLKKLGTKKPNISSCTTYFGKYLLNIPFMMC